MLDALLAAPGATLAGLGAFVGLTIWPSFTRRRDMLLAQLAAGALFATHYALLGVAAASLVNCLGCVQISAALFSGRSRALNSIGYALIPLMIAAGLVTWTGSVSALSVAAMSLIALGRMQQNLTAIRLLILAGGVFWMAHDYAVSSWIALAADIGSFVMGVAMLLGQRYSVRIERRWTEVAPAVA